VIHREEVEVPGEAIRVEVLSAAIEGRIEDSRHAAVSDGEVFLTPPSENGTLPDEWIAKTRVGQDGRFRLRDVSAGSWRIVVRASGFEEKSEPIEIDEAGKVYKMGFVLESAQGLTLQVRTLSGQSPAEVSVTVLDPGGLPKTTESFPIGEDGLVELRSLPSGIWDVLAHTNTGLVALEHQINVPGPLCPIVLALGGRLEILVPDLVETSVLAPVKLRDPLGHPLQFGFLRSGRAAVTLPVGTWEVSAEAVDGRSWYGSVSISSGETVDLTLE
jgi:hypothetical protein